MHIIFKSFFFFIFIFLLLTIFTSWCVTMACAKGYCCFHIFSFLIFFFISLKNEIYFIFIVFLKEKSSYNIQAKNTQTHEYKRQKENKKIYSLWLESWENHLRENVNWQCFSPFYFFMLFLFQMKFYRVLNGTLCIWVTKNHNNNNEKLC